MPDNSPSRVVSIIDALAAPVGRSYAELRTTLRFLNADDKTNFLAHLNFTFSPVTVTTSAGVVIPYTTLPLAKAGASSGNLITLAPGTYSGSGSLNLAKNGVGWNAAPHSTITYTGSTQGIMFDDSATGANGPVVETLLLDKLIYHGTHASAGGYRDGHCFTVDNAGSDVRVTANEISGYTTSGGLRSGNAIVQHAGSLSVQAKRIEGGDASIYWVNGDEHLRADTFTGMLYSYPDSSTMTGAMWIEGDLLTDAVGHADNSTMLLGATGTQSPTAPTAQNWVRMKEVRSARGVAEIGGGKNYLEAMKFGYTGTGNAAFVVSGGKTWATAQKISGAILQAGDDGVMHLATLDWLDDTTDTANFILLVGNSEIHLHGGYFMAATCNGIELDAGTLNLRGTTMDFSAVAGSNPVTLGGGTLNLFNNPTFKASTGRESITGTGSVWGHFIANTAIGAGVTARHGYTLDTGAAVTEYLPPINVNGTATATTFSGSGASLTGIPIATGISGLGAGIADFLATPSSANLAAAVTGETGSGALVLANSPTLTGSIVLNGLTTASNFTATSGTFTGLTTLGIRSSGSGAFDLILANTENLTAARTLFIATGNAARTLTLSGSPTLSGITTTGTGTLALGPFTLTVPATGTAVTTATLSDATLPGSFTTLAVSSGERHAVRVVTAAGAVTVATTDYFIAVNKTTGAATTVNLPASPATGTTFIIKDKKGDAATNNITITPNAGNIDGAATYVMNVNRMAVTIIYDGSEWSIY